MIDFSKLYILKKKMQLASDFSTPWNYFFDHFGENLSFMGMGKPVQNEMIEAVIKAVGQQIFHKKKVRLDNTMLTALPDYHFIHGACFLEGRLCILFFFSDIDQGLIAVHVHGNHTRLVRFTSTMVRGDTLDNYYMAPRDNTVN